VIHETGEEHEELTGHSTDLLHVLRPALFGDSSRDRSGGCAAGAVAGGAQRLTHPCIGPATTHAGRCENAVAGSPRTGRDDLPRIHEACVGRYSMFPAVPRLSVGRTPTRTRARTRSRARSRPRSPRVRQSPSPAVPESGSPRVRQSPSPALPESRTPRVRQSPSPALPESRTPRVPHSPSPALPESRTPRVPHSPSPALPESALPPMKAPLARSATTARAQLPAALAVRGRLSQVLAATSASSTAAPA
jgi:hypothetical protein